MVNDESEATTEFSSRLLSIVNFKPLLSTLKPLKGLFGTAFSQRKHYYSFSENLIIILKLILLLYIKSLNNSKFKTKRLSVKQIIININNKNSKNLMV